MSDNSNIQDNTTEIRIVTVNTSDVGGTFMTPFWNAFHNNSFDLFEAGTAASAGLEAMAEDGNFAPISAELVAADATAVSVVIPGEMGPTRPLEMASAIIEVDGSANAFFTTAAMILPSNDAFVGTGEAIRLFDEDGNFLAARNITFEGSDVYDAGTEVNTELDVPLLNQTGPNTGVDENGVVRLHEGFNGSIGNPVGEGDQNILGEDNAFGVLTDVTAADFTRPDAQISKVHVNIVETTTGTQGDDLFYGSRADDLVQTGQGRDVVFGGRGWDEISTGRGADVVFGGRGYDIIDGGGGRDTLFGGGGNDTLNGGRGNDFLTGGRGADQFVFIGGQGRDRVNDFNADQGDMIVLGVEGIDSLSDVLEIASDTGRGLVLDFGGDGRLILRDLEVASLTDSDFVFL